MARTFIQPGQELRKHGLRMKFNPLREVVEGKRLVVVDDSIVRGNTTRQIVQMLRDAGALEIHMRISAPPIRHPCHYGIDMSTTQEMVAHGRTEEEIAEELGCDSLAYLSLDGVYEAIRSTRETHCDACFSGEYPLERTDVGERQVRARGAGAVRPRAQRGRVRNDFATSVTAHDAAIAVAAGCGATVAVPDGPRPPPSTSTSASRLSGPGSARRARRRWRAATCWWSCPPARASRSATSCPRCCATT